MSYLLVDWVGLGWVGLTLILSVPLSARSDSAWADGILSELAGQLDMMVDTQIKANPNQVHSPNHIRQYLLSTKTEEILKFGNFQIVVELILVL